MGREDGALRADPRRPAQRGRRAQVQSRWEVAGVGIGGTGDDFNCRVWEVATGKGTITYNKHDNLVIAAGREPRWTPFHGGGDNKEIHVWELMTGETKHVLAGTGMTSWAVGVSSDAQWVAWGGTYQSSGYQDRGPLELQLRLPTGSQGLGQPERIDAASAKGFVRAHAQPVALSGSSIGKADARSDQRVSSTSKRTAVRWPPSSSIRRPACAIVPTHSRPTAGPSSLVAPTARFLLTTWRGSASATSSATRATSGR